jgi:regulatory protein
MSRNTLADLGLRIGQQISDRKREEMEQTIATNEAVAYCVERLSHRPHSRYQLAQALTKRELAEDIVRVCLDRCAEMLLLDDEDYARLVISARSARGYGPRRISQYLIAEARVDKELVTSLLEELFPREVEYVQASELLDRRFREPLQRAEQRKATSFLLRRGFDGDAVRAAVTAHAADDEDEPKPPALDGDTESPNQERAVQLLRRRYDAVGLVGDRGEQRRAWGYLARRGFSPDIISEAIKQTIREAPKN